METKVNAHNPKGAHASFSVSNGYSVPQFVILQPIAFSASKQNLIDAKLRKLSTVVLFRSLR